MQLKNERLIQVPRWLAFIGGLGYFTYQTFDGVDGKHAYRTKTNSLFGAIVDSACDTVAVGKSYF